MMDGDEVQPTAKAEVFLEIRVPTRYGDVSWMLVMIRTDSETRRTGCSD